LIVSLQKVGEQLGEDGANSKRQWHGLAKMLTWCVGALKGRPYKTGNDLLGLNNFTGAAINVATESRPYKPQDKSMLLLNLTDA
jgi:hypothetical protein